MVVPHAAGGSTGAVGFTATANADPDGYTVGATATDVTYLQELGFIDIGPDDLKGVLSCLPPEEFEAYLPEMSEQYTGVTRGVGIVAE